MKRLIVIVVLPLVFGGCWYAGMFSKSQTYSGKYSMDLPKTRADILDVVAKAGESMGYSVSRMDQGAGLIELQTGYSVGSSVITGSQNFGRMSIKLADGRKKLNIDISVTANYEQGTRASVTRLVEDLKNRINSELSKR